MKTSVIVGIVLFLALTSCKKSKQPEEVKDAPATAARTTCSKEIISEQPVKAGETGILLPAGTKLCVKSDKLSIDVELPKGYGFVTPDVNEKTLPVFATYACYCSVAGSACQVFYADEAGFGCLHSSCPGSCTGQFTYHGYSISRVVELSDKSSILSLPQVQEYIAAIQSNEPWSRHTVYGIDFYLVNDEAAFLAGASCDCEGTAACKLKVINLPFKVGEGIAKKIYYCDGGCNGCELTVD